LNLLSAYQEAITLFDADCQHTHTLPLVHTIENTEAIPWTEADFSLRPKRRWLAQWFAVACLRFWLMAQLLFNGLPYKSMMFTLNGGKVRSHFLIVNNLKLFRCHNH